MNAPAPVRTLLCDDHAVFAEAVAKLLRGRGVDTVVCRDPADAAALVRDEHFDVCLMDLVFDDDLAGLAGIRCVRATSPSTAVVALTSADDDDLERRCRASGAAAFVAKTASADALFDAIGRVRDGHGYFTKRDAPGPGVTDRDPAGRLASLTGREREVLARLLAGQTAAVIARELGVTYATARTHVQRVLVKLGAHSAVEAVAFAARHGVRAHESARAS
ncbi:MAG TPA: response regulator transcription factor [Acidimicrobiia bacterium]|nr:response regulator transcription factor [Acidimicrobiia bacterium]